MDLTSRIPCARGPHMVSGNCAFSLVTGGLPRQNKCPQTRDLVGRVHGVSPELTGHSEETGTREMFQPRLERLVQQLSERASGLVGQRGRRHVRK